MAVQTQIYGRRAAELRMAAATWIDSVGKNALIRAAERYETIAGPKPHSFGAAAVPRAVLGVLPLRPPAAPYRLQMWDKSGKRVERTLAESPDSRVAYAAYFEAAREFPMRTLTLTQNDRVLARWHPPGAGRR